jgi:hypothetical protein
LIGLDQIKTILIRKNEGIISKTNQPPRPERTFIFISIITARATPPSKGGDSYVINIQSIPRTTVINFEVPPIFICRGFCS